MRPTRPPLAGLVLAFAGCVSATTQDDGTRRHVADLEDEDVALHAERDVLGRRFEAVFEAVRPAPIEGLVLEVMPERQLVVIDKGARHAVEVGHVFTVQAGSTFKGLVRITDVREEMSSGTIFGEKLPIERGDTARAEP